ncbi:hypothetical protein CAAN1_05S05226 [[Candida] anglica]|uniref:Something about silencing protein 4 domain-containing protein n=1 Tax=[Candida] anglica TaxID=148631 RepID=A0ABP0EEF8_9ASCO
MAILDEHLRDTVHYTIESYVSQSKSKQLKHLIPSNEKRIVSLIKKDKSYQQELRDTLSKRDYYVNKLNKSLNALVESNRNTPIEDEEAKTENTRPKSNVESELDSRFISNRYHAEKYIQNLDDTSREKLRQVVRKHYMFQRHYENKRKAMIKDPSFNDAELDKKLDELTLEIANKQQALHQESIKLLEELKIPFFVLEKGWEYPELDTDKIYILQYLQRLTE